MKYTHVLLADGEFAGELKTDKVRIETHDCILLNVWHVDEYTNITIENNKTFDNIITDV